MNTTTCLLSECPACNGAGETFTFRGLRVCPLCSGAGEVNDVTASDFEHEQEDSSAYLQRKSN